LVAAGIDVASADIARLDKWMGGFCPHRGGDITACFGVHAPRGGVSWELDRFFATFFWFVSF
jgi:hypothetical protein